MPIRFPSWATRFEYRQITRHQQILRPGHSATAQLLTDLAGHLAFTGQPVTVITSRLNYDDPNTMLPPREILNGVLEKK